MQLFFASLLPSYFLHPFFAYSQSLGWNFTRMFIQSTDRSLHIVCMFSLESDCASVCISVCFFKLGMCSLNEASNITHIQADTVQHESRWDSLGHWLQLGEENSEQLLSLQANTHTHSCILILCVFMGNNMFVFK